MAPHRFASLRNQPPPVADTNTLPPLGPPTSASRARRLAIGTLLALCLAGIVVLMGEVLRELEGLRGAAQGNAPWSLAQNEIEFLLFDKALATASTPASDLTPLRRRFDITYSQMQTIRVRSDLAQLRRTPQVATAEDKLGTFIRDTAQRMDGPDAALRAALPDIRRDLQARRDDLHLITLKGVAEYARQSDIRREGLAATLLRLALLTLGLVLSLGAMVLALARLNRLNRTRLAEIARTRARLETVLETAMDAILVTGADDRVLSLNVGAERMLGLRAARALGRPAGDFLAGEGAKTDVLAGIGPGRHRLTARRDDGSTFPAEVSIAAATDPGGRINITIVRDISDRVAADRALRAARDRALAGERAKAEFLTVMSHEMRTPLNGLLGTVELMARTPLNPRQADYIEAMQTSGRLLLHHVNDVLDIASAEAGVVAGQPAATFDLAALLAEVAANQRSLAEHAGDTIGIDLPQPALPLLSGAPERLRQVLLNLVGNAVKFTEGGRITLSARAQPNAAAERTDAAAIAPEAALRIELRVTDTGIGIAPTDQKRIFGDFVTLDSSYRRNARGTGLGLGIAQRLVRAMGGTIGVDSTPGKGSCFWVRVPLMPARNGAVVMIDGTGNGTDAPRTTTTRPAALGILLVEDNSINRFVARELLEAEGHTVTEAADGREGTELATTRRFDLILMDISMPHMDGLEAARAIRAAPGGSNATPIVALTAHALPDDLARFHDAGVHDSLTKPITRKSLAAILARTRPDEASPESAAVGAGDTTGGSPLPPLIDLPHLAEMRADLGADSLAALLHRFIAEGDATVESLTAVAPREGRGAAAHKLTGSAAVFGARALVVALRRVETVPEDQARAALVACWADTRAELERQIADSAR